MEVYKGCVERLTARDVHGWVTVPRTDGAEASPPEVEIRVGAGFVATGAAAAPRRDVSTDTVLGFGFVIRFAEQRPALASPAEFSATLVLPDRRVPIDLYAPVRLAIELECLSDDGNDGLVRAMMPATHARLKKSLGTPNLLADARNARAELGVFTYAQSADGWFPVFHRHYAAIVGAERIHVVTPQPAAFAGYLLGSVISVAGSDYDDIARARLMSGLASGFQAYYRWSLVCDVDEILVPWRGHGAEAFLAELAAAQGDILVSRGFDMLQGADEPDFDPGRDVLAQRRFGMPNTAMCKPHLARVPIVYSGGYHYCQQRVDFSPPGAGFLTLHLKWACRKMRAAVLGTVQDVRYSTEAMAAYSRTSVEPEKPHPYSGAAALALAVPPTSEQLRAFERRHLDTVDFIPALDMWIGKHVTANFVVDLGAA